MSTKKLLSRLLVFGLLLSVVVLAIPQTTVQAAAEDARGGPGRPDVPGGNGWGVNNSGSATALTPLSEAEAEALQEAILEEYGAYNLYQAVIDQFGAVYPFDQIARSEQQHTNALIRQATRYNLEVPANPGLTSTPVFDSLAEACQTGVDAEIADAALYDELLTVTDHADLIQVYTRLQSASLESHLPIFELCN